MAAFFEMGGYAAFVWPAYAVAAVILAGFTMHAVTRYRSVQRRVTLLQRTDSSGRMSMDRA